MKKLRQKSDNFCPTWPSQGARTPASRLPSSVTMDSKSCFLCRQWVPHFLKQSETSAHFSEQLGTGQIPSVWVKRPLTLWFYNIIPEMQAWKSQSRRQRLPTKRKSSKEKEKTSFTLKEKRERTVMVAAEKQSFSIPAALKETGLNVMLPAPPLSFDDGVCHWLCEVCPLNEFLSGQYVIFD